jgi:hypothetical protein
MIMEKAKVPVTGKAARINERLLKYWRSIKPTYGLPMESDIDPDVLYEVWESCFLITVGEPPSMRYEYAMLGDAIIHAYSDDNSGKAVCEELLYPLPAPMIAAFDEVVQTKEPLVDDNSFVNSSGMVIKYRSCLVPLAKDNEDEVGFILGGMKWKAF